MTRVILLLSMAFALAACSPANACRSYGFQEGTTAFSQCIQAEVLAYQQRMAK
jgi:hypothetical protein